MLGLSVNEDVCCRQKPKASEHAGADDKFAALFESIDVECMIRAVKIVSPLTCATFFLETMASVQNQLTYIVSSLTAYCPMGVFLPTDLE